MKSPGAGQFPELASLAVQGCHQSGLLPVILWVSVLVSSLDLLDCLTAFWNFVFRLSLHGSCFVSVLFPSVLLKVLQLPAASPQLAVQYVLYLCQPEVQSCQNNANPAISLDQEVWVSPGWGLGRNCFLWMLPQTAVSLGFLFGHS